jgi:hypothetical protein
MHDLIIVWINRYKRDEHQRAGKKGKEQETLYTDGTLTKTEYENNRGQKTA